MARSKSSTKRYSDLTLVRNRGHLVDLQRNFLEIIRYPLDSNDLMRTDPRSCQMIAPSKLLTSHERMNLYAQQYWWRLQQSMDEDFPSLRRCLRASTYTKLRDSYIYEMPSVSFTLRNFGSRFWDYTLKTKLLNRAEKGVALDCIAFDWAKIEVFDASDVDDLSDAIVKRRGFIRTALTLKPSVRIISLEHPVFEVVINSSPRKAKELSNSKSAPNERRQIAGAKLRRRRCYLLVFRGPERVGYKEVSRAQYNLLMSLKVGASIKRLFDDKSNIDSACSVDVHQFFQELSALGLITLKKQKGRKHGTKA